jgi:hypothetical protein
MAHVFDGAAVITFMISPEDGRWSVYRDGQRVADHPTRTAAMLAVTRLRIALAAHGYTSKIQFN